MEIREYTRYNEDEILKLYSAVGWTSYTKNPSVLKRGYDNSLLTLAAYEGSDLLGIIRAVGDSATIICIQDLLVFPEQQRKGVRSALLREMLDRYTDVRQIVLITDQSEKTVAFYQSEGLQELSRLGCCGFMKC